MKKYFLLLIFFIPSCVSSNFHSANTSMEFKLVGSWFIESMKINNDNYIFPSNIKNTSIVFRPDKTFDVIDHNGINSLMGKSFVDPEGNGDNVIIYSINTSQFSYQKLKIVEVKPPLGSTIYCDIKFKNDSNLQLSNFKIFFNSQDRSTLRKITDFQKIVDNKSIVNLQKF